MCYSDPMILWSQLLVIGWNQRIEDPEDNCWVGSIGLGETGIVLQMKKEEIKLESMKNYNGSILLSVLCLEKGT